MARSHPSRVRELKPVPHAIEDKKLVSHPSRVRELKLDSYGYDRVNRTVAPLPGA